MSDQPTDRPPKYGGPRNRTRNVPDAARPDLTELSRRTRGEPTRRSTDHRSQGRDESRLTEDRPHDRHPDRTPETSPPPDRPRSRNRSQSRPRDAQRRPPSRDWPDSQPRRYGETYHRDRAQTPPERQGHPYGERSSRHVARSDDSSPIPREDRRSGGAHHPSAADEHGRDTRRTSTSERSPPRNRQRTESRETPPREPRAPFDRPADADHLEIFEPLDFETAVQKRVYRYVERRGVASPEEVEAHLDLPADDLADAIRRLEQKDYLEQRDGTLRVAHATDVETEYAVAGVDVTIRHARQEDLADLVALIRTVTDERTYVVAESVAAQLAYEETVIRHTDTRSRTFFVAEVDADAERAPDSRLVGWAHLTLPGIEYLDHTAELTVGVHADFRRRGVGSQLMRIALEWAAANDYYKVYQSLPGTNRAAIDFLDAHGWMAEAVRSDHYRIDGEFVDEVMMAYAL